MRQIERGDCEREGTDAEERKRECMRRGRSDWIPLSTIENQCSVITRG